MNGEALKIHIPSTTYPQFVHNRPLLSFLKRSKPPFRAHLALLTARKTQKARDFFAAPRKTLGQGAAGRRRGVVRREGNIVRCAFFPTFGR
jgi:hypothetical protein